MNDQTETAAGTPPDKDARTWGMLCHLMALSGYIIPLGNLLGPIIIWAIKKDDAPFINDQGKEAINFQITVTIMAVIAIILSLIAIGFLLLAALMLYNVVMVVVAAIKSYDGESYRYPFTIRLLK